MKTKKMFSIVEVVLVVAIVMTLLSILVSNIKTGKDMAVKVACMSNISQIRNYAELYRKDNAKLPYSEIWLTDFSFAADYMDGKKSLEVFTCPGSKDETLHEYSQLKYNTSYFYVPNAALWEKNIADGQPYGIDQEQVRILKASENGVIYDKSPDHHLGKINIARLFKQDDPHHSMQGTITTITDDSKLIALAGDTTLELPELADLNLNETGGEAAGNSPEDPDNDETPDEAIDFSIDDGVLTVNEDSTATYKLIGASISYGGQYDMPVTTKFRFREPGGTSDVIEPFGGYGDPIGGNCNGDSQKSFTPPKVYPAGTEITALGKSWKKIRSKYSGNSISHWKKYLEFDSNASSNIIILRNGSTVPQIAGFLNQTSIEEYVGPYITDGKIKIEENQAIFLFELGTTNLGSSAADFQDLCLLVTLFPANRN